MEIEADLYKRVLDYHSSSMKALRPSQESYKQCMLCKHNTAGTY